MTPQEQYRRWLHLPDLTPDERQSLAVFGRNEERLQEAFGVPLRFGTAGLRGTMGMGPAHLNRFTVAWAAAGVAAWLAGKNKSQSLVIICGDSRHHSDLFCETAARTLLSLGHRVLLWRQPTPVPVLSWSVRAHGAAAGIAITASHNPKEYNGFKVYNSRGSQLLADDCAPITATFDAFLAGEDLPFSLNTPLVTPLPIMPPRACIGYLDALFGEGGTFAPFSGRDATADPKLLYTPLHGTGAPYVMAALRRAGFGRVSEVASQSRPDGDFPTAPTPNPESPSAYEEAFRLARREKPDAVIATDPDCDRMGVAVQDEDTYRILNGNEVAALLVDYLATAAPRRSGDTVFTSVVSSPFAKRLATARGLHLEETLTGFKYIGEGAERPPHKGGSFFFGYEESCGYLYGDHARDKDGIIAALLFAAALRALLAAGKTPLARLAELGAEIGHWADANFDIRLAGPAAVAAGTLDALRDADTRTLLGVPVEEITDFRDGHAGLPPENMLRYRLANATLAVRPSGTEPKIKCYVSACGDDPEAAASLAKDLAHRLKGAVARAKELCDHDTM